MSTQTRLSIRDLDDLARSYGCRVVTDALIQSFQQASRRGRQSEVDNVRLRAALAHEPWWRRRKA